MIVAIHQPNFLPWPGYFYKLARADVFVFLDNAQYIKESFINRNRIKTPSGAQWLTVPVCSSGKPVQTIQEVQMVPAARWRRKHLHLLEAYYRRAPHFKEIYGMLESQYAAVDSHTLLADFNISMTRAVSSYLDLNPILIRARDLDAGGTSTERLVNICRELGADCYLAGGGAVKYQDDQQFASAGIGVEYSDFRPEPYSQPGGAFLGGLSIVDALMNCGKSAKALLSTRAREISSHGEMLPAT